MGLAKFLDLVPDIWDNLTSTSFVEFDLFFGMRQETEEVEHEVSLMPSHSPGRDDEDSGLVEPVWVFDDGERLVDFCHCWYNKVCM